MLLVFLLILFWVDCFDLLYSKFDLCSCSLLYSLLLSKTSSCFHDILFRTIFRILPNFLFLPFSPSAWPYPFFTSYLSYSCIFHPRSFLFFNYCFYTIVPPSTTLSIFIYFCLSHKHLLQFDIVPYCIQVIECHTLYSHAMF